MPFMGIRTHRLRLAHPQHWVFACLLAFLLAALWSGCSPSSPPGPAGGQDTSVHEEGDEPRNGPEDNPTPPPEDKQEPPPEISPPSSVTSALSAVWANDGGDKVARGELRASADANAVINSIWNGSAVQLFGARNEVLGFALILEAAKQDATTVSVRLDLLAGPQGAAISSTTPSAKDGVFDWTARDIEIFTLRYLQIKGTSPIFYQGYDERHAPHRLQRPWSGDGVGQGTWSDRPDHDAFYPEIAVPIELTSSFSISAGENQSVWIDVFIPKDVPAGPYHGMIAVLEDGVETKHIPVTLMVRNFSLPDVPTCKTMVHLGYRDINLRYTGVPYPNAGTSEEIASNLIRDRHFQLAHRHRLSLIDANDGATPWDQDQPRSEWLPRLDGSLFTAARGYRGPGAGAGNNIYAIGVYGSWGWQDEGEAGMRTHTDAWATWFQAHAPGTEFFLYLIDESDDSPQIEQWAGWINANPGPGHAVKSFATIGLPEALQHTPSLDIPASWMQVGDAASWQAAADALHAAGKRVFLYNSRRPGSGTFAIEDDGVALRELAWGQFKKKIDRWFFWESSYYNNYQGGTGETNIFQNAMTFGLPPSLDGIQGLSCGNCGNGDGVLFYPGTDTLFPAESSGIAGPLASLRMKLWRRGIQDVDYLTMAAAVDPQRVEEIVETMLPVALWEYGVSDPADPTWVRTAISWSTDPDDWEAAREELAGIIEGK